MTMWPFVGEPEVIILRVGTLAMGLGALVILIIALVTP